jgi:hypothetical protein
MANLISTNITGTLNTTGNTTAAGYTGNANVGGTGAATWHPSGIYCGSTMWQYGAQYKSNTGIYNLLELNLNNGFYISQGGSDYGQFNSWVKLPGYHGFFSDQNGAHLYPNNATYGSWRIAGSRNSYNGITFDASNGHVSLMINTSSNVTGFHNNSYDWQFYWSSGTLYCFKNTYGGGTQATVLDSSNAAYAWNMNQYVRTSDSVEFDNIVANGDLKVIGAFRDSNGNVGSSGQILSSTVTGTAWIAAPSGGGGTLSGSGTTNYVSKWTGSTSLGNSIIFDNGTNVGIGTASPSDKLHVRVSDTQGYVRIGGSNGAGNSRVFIAAEGDSSYMDSYGNNTHKPFSINANPLIFGIGNVLINTTTNSSYRLDVNGTIRASGDIIAYSDARVKENVNTIEGALDKVLHLRGVSYNKIGETDKKVGVIAQEVLEVLPEVVSEDLQGMYSVAYGNIVGVLIEAIKEQQHQIEELKTEIQNLKSN